MSHSDSKKVIFAALVGNTLISITKLGAATITGSSAMLSEGIHSLVDTGNQGLLLLGLKKSQKPEDKDHPFGYGKEVYFWSFLVVIMIFGVGAGVSLYEGIHHIQHPTAVENPNLTYIVLAVSFLFEGAAWMFAFKAFTQSKGHMGVMEAVRKSKDPSTFVVLFEDSAAMLGILVAFTGIFLAQVTGMAWLDGAASVVIGLILAGTAWLLAVETKDLLIGEAALPEVVEKIRFLAGSVSEVDAVNEVLTLHMGPEYILANLSLDFRNDCSASEVEQAVADLDAAIKFQLPSVKKVFIEAEAMGTSRSLGN